MFTNVVMLGILLVCEKRLHNRIISLNGKVLVHTTRLTPPSFNVHAPNQTSNWSCMCVFSGDRY